jgi:stage IV sporulation protein FB
MNGGFFTISVLRGIPIRLHWSVAVGAFVLGRFRFVPAYWAGFVLLILLHELGHAVMVRRYGLGVSEIVIHGVGGYCRHDRAGTAWQTAVIAWGGVLVQSLVYLLAVGVAALVGPITSSAGWQLLYLFTESNLWLICINLMPIAPLDGKEAWTILPQIRDRLRARFGRRGQGHRESSDERTQKRDELDAATRAHQEAQQLVRDLLDRTTKGDREK